MKKLNNEKLQQHQDKDRSRHRCSPGKIAYCAFLCIVMSMAFCQPAFAATDVWTKAKEIMQDVYTQILAISTIAAIVTASVALLMMNFSRSGRTVDESRAWLKRICITWAILNGLGFIMAYVTITQTQHIMQGSFDPDAFATGEYVLAIGPAIGADEEYPVLPVPSVGSKITLEGKDYTVMAVVYKQYRIYVIANKGGQLWRRENPMTFHRSSA